MKPIKIKDVVRVYSGKQHTCYCGCAGRYYVASAHVVEAGKERGYPVKPDEISDEISDEMVKKVVTFVNRNLDIAERPKGFNFITVPYSKTKEYTVYLKDRNN